jgi:hypothetical protein
MSSRFCFAVALLAMVSFASYAPAQVRAKAKAKAEVRDEVRDEIRDERREGDRKEVVREEDEEVVREEREVVREGREAAPQAASYRAKEVLGAKVQIEGERSVGTVDDIVLDDNGNVDYLIVLTADKELVSVPWDAASFQPKQRIAKVNITQEKFEKVPTYTTEKYPTFTPEYRNQTYKYYGLTPGQARRAVRRGAAAVR